MGRAGDGPSGDLAALVEAGDVAAVSAFCAALSPDAPERTEQRAAVTAVCAPVFKHAWSVSGTHTADQLKSANIAMTAVGTIGELRKCRHWPVPTDLELTYHLVAARESDFRDAWAAAVMNAVSWHGRRVARRLVFEGLAAKPDSDDYTIALVSGPVAFDLTVSLREQYPPQGRTATEILRANPDLLVDDLWRIFEVEGGGENSLAAHDKYTSVDHSWQTALVTLAGDGTLDRDRLLDASLDALQRGFAQFRAQWFSAFHEALEPTIDERTARTSTYLALAASPIGPTVTMALKALGEVQKAGGLDPVEVAAGIGPALVTPAKGSATKAVALLAKVAARDPAYIGDAADTMVGAFGHPAKEVQAAALKHLRSWYPDGAPDVLAHRISEVRDGCHVSVRGDLDSWAGSSVASVPSESVAAAPAVVRSIDITTVDWLAPDRALVAITDIDELFERASSAMENPGDPDDIEIVLTAIAATGRAAVADDGRARTLAKRAAKLQSNAERVAQAYIATAIVAWLDPERRAEHRPRPTPRSTNTVALDSLLEARVHALAHALESGETFVPLAAPTHRGGWIDPTVLVERLLSLPAKEVPHPAELSTALLRLAPIPARLAEADQRAGRSKQVSKGVRTWLAGWAAWCAAEATRPAGWTSTSESHTYTDTTYTHYYLSLDGGDAVIAPPGAPLAIQLQSSRWGVLSGHYSHDPAALAWVGSLIPGLPAAWARVGADGIGPTYGTRDVQHGDPGLLQRFFDPDVPLGGDAYLLLSLALNDPRPEIHGLAVDLALTAIDDRRLDSLALGDQVGRLASTGVVTPARWGRTLTSVAAPGPSHRAIMRAALEEAIAVAEPRKPQDVLVLIELLETLLLEDGLAVSNRAARAKLEDITGSSKTAKAAARLVALR